MLHTISNKVHRLRFSLRARGVFAMPAVSLDGSSPIAVLSMVQHQDVQMYLLAIKSFCSHVRPRGVYVIDDGSLDGHDKELLARHVAGIEIIPLERHRNALCPAGGCWERLLTIAELVNDHYVVQLDSDTLTVGPIEEVAACVVDGAAFTIGTWDGQCLEPMAFRSAEARSRLQTGSSHVQLHAEAHLKKLVGSDSMRYVRGCAGFTGFPKDSFSREFVENISTQMNAEIGRKWHEWGSEQVMSNIVVANTPGARVLPHPKYANCQKMTQNSEFIHFIGPCRFTDGRYAKLGRQVIRGLVVEPGRGVN